jgi:hypothetical protein
MTAWLLAALDRLSPRWRRVAVALPALLLLAAAITALILEARTVERQRRPSPALAPVVRRPPPRRLAPRTAHQPVSAAELRRASEVAERFAVSYLRFAYGRATARSVVEVEPALRSQLIRGRSPVTPIERQRHPRLLSLHTVGTMPGFVVATATVEDGGIAAYRLRFSLEEHSGRWLVGTVEEG